MITDEKILGKIIVVLSNSMLVVMLLLMILPVLLVPVSQRSGGESLWDILLLLTCLLLFPVSSLVVVGAYDIHEIDEPKTALFPYLALCVVVAMVGWMGLDHASWGLIDALHGLNMLYHFEFPFGCSIAGVVIAVALGIKFELVLSEDKRSDGELLDACQARLQQIQETIDEWNSAQRFI